MQTADDDRVTYSCCDLPLVDEKWTPDSNNEDEVKSSNGSRSSRNSTADWYQQQLVHMKHATLSGDLTRMTLREQDKQAAAVSDCDPSIVGSLLFALQF